MQSVTLQNKIVGNGFLKLNMSLLGKEATLPNDLTRLRTAAPPK